MFSYVFALRLCLRKSDFRLNPLCEIEQSSDAPRLRDAAFREVRGIAAEDLADGSESRFAQMIDEWKEEIIDRLRILVDAKMSLNHRHEEPRPDCSLVIRTVARFRIASIMSSICRILRTQCSQPLRRPESSHAEFNDCLALPRRQQTVADRRCKKLIWSQ